MPKPRPEPPRVDTTAADVASLVAMGVMDPPPVPSPEPPWASPPAPMPEPTPTEQANELMLQSALVDAGVEKTTADEAAIDALARMDPSAVATVTKWLREKKNSKV